MSRAGGASREVGKAQKRPLGKAPSKARQLAGGRLGEEPAGKRGAGKGRTRFLQHEAAAQPAVQENAQQPSVRPRVAP